jgi:hypothetical protein
LKSTKSGLNFLDIHNDRKEPPDSDKLSNDLRSCQRATAFLGHHPLIDDLLDISKTLGGVRIHGNDSAAES